MWLKETLYDDLRIALRGELVYKKKSPHQDLRVYQSASFGRVLLLDGAIQTTERDEFIYHEMLTHPLLLSVPRPEKVLLIGAGDGGILREVLKHPVKKAVLVEIDREVISLSEKYLSSICGGAFSHPKTEIVIEDGARFLTGTQDKFDVVIVDSPDPVGVAKSLFTPSFYKNIYRVLSSRGMMIRQTGSTFLQKKDMKKHHHTLSKVFPVVTVQLTAIPTYVGGFFSCMIGSKKIDPRTIRKTVLEKRYKSRGLRTQYYNTDMHHASMVMPNYVREEIQ
ncbi:MAG: polyamine aminopropyltransferase [Candidatus Omnitrophica bacterium]|nr:polyamine aminopropyltransferase [Candidatus Omnitrophota bacterium]